MFPAQLIILAGLFISMAVMLYMMRLFISVIPNNRIGILEKRIGRSIESGFIALNGEAGYQPQVLRGGMHMLMPLRDFVHIVELVTVPPGNIGYVFARDGQPLGYDQTLASNLNAKDVQNTEEFLRNGGQRGSQRQILREGTYAINLAQFVVFTELKTYSIALPGEDDEIVENMSRMILERDGFHTVVIQKDMVGIVTVHDGPLLPEGQILAPVVGQDPQNWETYHNNFQDPDRFLYAGGMRGLQSQFLYPGTYYINRLFATVEIISKSEVDKKYEDMVELLVNPEEKAAEKTKIEIAGRMLLDNLDMELISKYTGLSLEYIRNLEIN